MQNTLQIFTLKNHITEIDRVKFVINNNGGHYLLESQHCKESTCYRLIF